VDKQFLSAYSSLASWDKLKADFSVTDAQAEQLALYADMLVEWNKKFNLTSITKPDQIVTRHFYDSLAISRYIDLQGQKTIADVGTGAGFPGIPLKILFPELTVILIEVNAKKRLFLESVIQELGLTDVILYEFEWRNFLRSTDYDISYFFARASLQPDELLRIFRPSCAYQHAQLVYWASLKWVPALQEKRYISREVTYEIAENVKRKYVFFTLLTHVKI
jgi:16S rRNA (guanine(527)-N(7))-methyltransferase RsmG